jgi:hypothetical protein
MLTLVVASPLSQESKSEQAIMDDDSVAQKVCQLFGITLKEFTKYARTGEPLPRVCRSRMSVFSSRALLTPKVKAGRDYVTKAQNKAQV